MLMCSGDVGHATDMRFGFPLLLRITQKTLSRLDLNHGTYVPKCGQTRDRKDSI